jgi:hypothetical protein
VLVEVATPDPHEVAEHTVGHLAIVAALVLEQDVQQHFLAVELGAEQ